jgi:hypothetical protein
MGRKLFFTLLFLIGRLYIEAIAPNPYVKEDVWEQVSPYLIPDDHPAKEILDSIFSKSRIIKNIESMEKAGFKNVFPQKYTRIIVTTHPDLPGYIIKVYLDDQEYYLKRPEHYHYIKRAKGVRMIQNIIDEKGWNDQFKAPKKWIYPLPPAPPSPDNPLQKYFLLIEDDMDIYSKSVNEKMWKSDKVTYELLDHLYFITESKGFHDCAKPANIPFSKDGRVAFVDTQTHNRWPVKYYKLGPCLSKKNRIYWEMLTTNSK